MKTYRIVWAGMVAVLALTMVQPRSANADFLCKAKKGAAVFFRPTCKKSEVAVGTLGINSTNNSASANASIGLDLNVSDSGAVSSGVDSTTGFDLSVSHLGAGGGNINTSGMNISVIGDGGGDSTNVGLSVSASGADTNYSALFQGGNVGIGVNDPDEQLELTGRIHLGQSSAPGTVTDKLYNVGGVLFWNGQELADTSDIVDDDSGITSVVAGTGLSGGGSTGSVTLNVNTGTGANQIVSLNSSGELPALSGVNLSSLNASNLGSGTVPDGRLSSNVTQLGSTIGLASEVSGTLPVANGGTGATSLSDLLTLGTHTTGSYVASVATSSGLSGGASGSEAATLSLSVDQSFSPNWTGTHSFQGTVNVGTTTSSAEALHLNGRMLMEQTSAPSTTTDKLYNVGGALFFNGVNLSTGAAGGDITGVTAGTGLNGGGASGAVTLNVNVGTGASQIVQLNGSSQLPAVSGVNLTNLNGTNIASGTVSDARLSANVSLLGSAVSLATEVTGTLPIANGGTGATALTDLVTLGTHTTGDYVAVVATGGGITLGSTGSEGGTATLSLNQAFAPTWTASHTFSGVATDITTVSNQDFCVMPNGTGKVGIGTTSPSAMLDVVHTSTSTTAGTDRGAEINVSDTGVVTSGTDSTIGLDMNVSRTGATSGTIDTKGLDISVVSDGGGATTATGLDVVVSGADANYAALFNGGSVGIGTSAPTAIGLDIESSTASTTAGIQNGMELSFTDSGVVSSGTDVAIGLDLNLSRTGASSGTINSTGLDIGVTGDAGGTSQATGLSVSVTGADVNVAATFVGGSVGIGDSVSVTSSNVPAGSLVLGNGALCVDDGGVNCDDASLSTGTIYAENTSVQSVDLAENFPIEVDDKIEAGEIAVINTHLGQKCMEFEKAEDGSKKCARSILGNIPFVTRAKGDTTESKRIIGIISTKPGFTLGGWAQDELINYQKVPVALAGRVPLKVNLENGPIEIGDRIVASSVPGQGMKSNGSGSIVGIALEAFDQILISEGQDRILVLVK